jgi:mannobiose 2-epimerase
MKTPLVITTIAVVVVLSSGCKHGLQRENKLATTLRTTDRETIAKEMEEVLTTGMMDLWYPRCVDNEFGGYLSGFDKEWNQKEQQPKFIVTQARHTWTSAQMVRMYPEKSLYREVSEHGYKFLRDVMWDQEYGGYYTLTDRKGNLLAMDDSETTKIAYGNAFAIYGLAAYFEISHDSSALELAIKSFHWLDKHSHDPEYGGYFQFLERDGTPIIDGLNGIPPKDQNSSIHIIEGFTELYKIWKNEHLKSRIEEMLVLIRDTITTEKGYMNLFFHRDWTPVILGDEIYPGIGNKHQFDYISFGHDIETAYLLLEASEVIGIENDQTTLRVSKRMADHTLRTGWDPKTGATYEAGYYFEDQEEMIILEEFTQWWAATESFHTMLIMSELYPNDPIDYYDHFTLTWDYCKIYLIDSENGGWYRLGTNESPQSADGDKGGIWKGNYHNARSLMNCIKLLRKSEV